MKKIGKIIQNPSPIGDPEEIVRKKLVNITRAMDREIKLRMDESGRSEMGVFRDAILIPFGRLSEFASGRLDEYAREHGLSRERAAQVWLAEIASVVEGRGSKSKK